MLDECVGLALKLVWTKASRGTGSLGGDQGGALDVLGGSRGGAKGSVGC